MIRADATRLPVADDTIACAVTSPPYNCDIEYAEYDDRMPWPDYRRMANATALEMRRALIPGGRVWVNIQPTVPATPGVPGGPRVNLARIWTTALTAAGLTYRDTVVWVQDSHDGQCAWGSWLQPSAPNMRGGHELILVFSKGEWYRETPTEWKGWRAPKDELGGDWAELCRNVWPLRPERRRKDAPAPYPLELPARAIRLSTWPEERVLDPFVGSGTTLDAAAKLGRVGVGIDLYGGSSNA